MKTNTLAKAYLVFVTAVFFAMASVSFAAQASADRTETKAVKEKVADAAEAIKNYSVDQRDEALKKAKTVLDELDARIDRMQSQLNGKWDQMDQSTRKKAMDALTVLRKQRNEIAEWYGGLKHSSSNAWEDVKKGFLRSYQELRDAFDKAQSEF
jgi:acyl-CoA reductase-like NAD-dependent aldehyde dehydrogenase